MKNNIKLLGIIAVTAVIGLSLFGCKQEPEAGGISLPSTPDIGKAPAFSPGVTFLDDRDKALQLLKDITPSTLIGSKPWVGNPTGFFDAYTKAFNAASADVKPNTSSTETSSSSNASLTIDYTSTDVAGLKINGSTSGSRSITGTAGSGTTTTNSNRSANNMTFEFPLKAASTGTTARYQAGGVIRVEGHENTSSTTKITGTTLEDLKSKTESRKSEKTAYSFVLTVIDTQENKGAKYRFSFAESADTHDRSASSSNFSETSTLEILNGDDEVIFTDITGLKNSSLHSTITDLVEHVIAGRWGTFLTY